MKQYIERVLNVRRGEYAVTFLMFFYYYLLLMTYYFLKPARDSLFLVKLGSDQLPFVFILIALIVAPITALYSRAGKSLKLNKLIIATTVILIASLFVLRFLVQLEDSWVYYAFYIWVSVYGVLSTSQFWLFANAVYNPAQAKRIFVLLTLGGIVGAFTGGEVTGFFVKNLGVTTENLLLFCAGFLIICIVLVNIIWKLSRAESEQIKTSSRREIQRTDGLIRIFGTIKQSRHLMYIVGIITVTMMVASFVDFQFKTVSLEAFPDKEQLTVFFGKFYGRLSLVSLFFHMFFSYTLLRVLGVGGVILFLPLGLLTGSIAMFIAPGLMSGILLRGVDVSFKYSIDKTGRELLFMPVPLDIKKRTKVFIDVVIDRGARGLAGVLLLLFTVVFDFSVRQISIVVIVLLAVWIVIAVLTKREYLNAFRLALAKREIDPGELRININEASTVTTLKNSLASDNVRQVEYALDMLETVKGVKLADEVKPLLKHDSSKIRLKAVRILQSQGSNIATDEIEKLLDDTDPDVQLAAMNFLYVQSGEGGEHVFRRFLDSSDPRLVSITVRCIAEFGKPEQTSLITEDIVRKLMVQEGKDCEICRIQLAKALGASFNPEFRQYLLDLMDDSSSVVAQVAVGSAGKTGYRDFIPVLLKKLADKHYRMNARMALAEYGNHILGTLRDHLTDDTVDFVIRKNIPGVLYMIPTQESVNVLTDCIKSAHPSLSYYIIKALNKLRSKYSGLACNHTKINKALIKETVSYYEILTALSLHSVKKESDAGKLLKRALEEKLDKYFEHIFRLLGLYYPSGDIYNAYRGVVSGNTRTRASAIEFLDNMLGSDIKSFILPILEQDTPGDAVEQGQKQFNIQIKSFENALEHLVRSDDPWLKACALLIISEEKNEKLKNLVREAANDSDPVVSETAHLVMERLKSS